MTVTLNDKEGYGHCVPEGAHVVGELQGTPIRCCLLPVSFVDISLGFPFDFASSFVSGGVSLISSSAAASVRNRSSSSSSGIFSSIHLTAWSYHFRASS